MTDPAIPNPWSCPAGEVVTRADASRAEWLAARRTLIGGSDVAKLLGVGNPNYGDAYSLWAEKTGLLPDSPSNLAQQRGLIFEASVIELWSTMIAEFEIKTRRAGLIRSKAHPHLGASVDRLSVCNYDGTWHRCVIEAKTQMSLAEWDDEDVPVSYQFQGLAQLIATGREHVHYVVMGPRWQPEHRILHRDAELEAEIIERVDQFWELVETNTPPEPDYRSLDSLRAIMRGEPGKTLTIDADDPLAMHVAALRTALSEKVEIDRTIDSAIAVIQARMSDAETLQWDNEAPIATWKTGKTIDGANADWRREHADLVSQFSKPGPDVLDIDKLIENHPELIGAGGLRRRRMFKPSAKL